MADFVTNIVALIMNPISLLIFLIFMKHMKKGKGKEGNPFWASHQGRGA